MSYQNYAEVKQLNPKILSKLLATGDAQERIWAAWETGIRLGKEALPSISIQAGEAPDPGTRRHMIVVLAGLGQHSVLKTLAFNDPNETVRGTSIQYIIKTADKYNTEKINLVVDLLKKDKSLPWTR